MNIQFLKYNKFLGLITLSYFLLGFYDVHFGLLGIFCVALPFYFLLRTNRKTYCQGYCPRSNLFILTAKTLPFSKNRKTPDILFKSNFKWYLIGYLTANFIFIVMSTITAYYYGRVILNIRILLFINAFSLPENLALDVPIWITHLSYRVYSFLYGTTVFGIILAILYKPRSWCTICPVATVSTAYLDKINK